jgi:hypothetical protein
LHRYITALQGEFVVLGALNDNSEGPQKYIPATDDEPAIYGKKRKLLTEEEKIEAARRNVTSKGSGGNQTRAAGNPAVVSLDEFRDFEYVVLETSKENPVGLYKLNAVYP